MRGAREERLCNQKKQKYIQPAAHTTGSIAACLHACRQQASHPLTQKLSCPSLPLLSHSCGTGRAITLAAVPVLAQRHPQSSLTTSPKPLAELGKCKPNFLPAPSPLHCLQGLLGAGPGSTGAAPGTRNGNKGIT